MNGAPILLAAMGSCLLLGVSAPPVLADPPTVVWRSPDAGAPMGPLELHLACDGIGTYAEGGGSTVFVVDDQRNSTDVSGVEVHRGRVQDEVLVDVFGNDARIRLPGVMLPKKHKRDDEGWLRLGSPRITDRDIAGNFKVNFLNKPTVSISRMTGHIELKGGSKLSFSGECHTYDVSLATRKF